MDAMELLIVMGVGISAAVIVARLGMSAVIALMPGRQLEP